MATGLYKCGAGKAIDASSPVPLKALRATVNVIDFCSEVCMAQEYENAEDVPIEAVFCFPLLSTAAVTGFIVTNGGKRLEGKVERSRAANIEYSRAVDAGQTAVLMKEVSHDLMQCHVGNIAAHSGVSVEIVYVTELHTEEDALRFRLPLTVIPRYMNGRGPAPVSSNEKPTFALEFKASFSMSAPIETVSSLTHDISIDMEDNRMHGTVSLSHVAVIDRDLDLRFSLKAIDEDEKRKPLVVLEKHPKLDSKAVLISFFPKMKRSPKKSEIILVIDRSGSMRGERINMAKEALHIFLRSLPEDCYFNIVGFGSKHQMLFDKSAVYDERNLEKATAHVDSIEADLGGTAIHGPLIAICKVPKRRSVHFRSIILLTDGAVSNTRRVLEYAHSHRKDTRIFTLGIGSGCSTELVNGLADKSGGAAEFVVEGEAMSPKVVQQLRRSMENGLTDLRVDWAGLPLVTSASSTAIFSGDRLLLYGIQADKEKASSLGSTVAKITATSLTDGKVSFHVPLDFSDDLAIGGDLIHRLAVKSLVKESTTTQSVSEHLSLTYGVASQYCSFLVVDPDNAGDVRSRIVNVATPQPTLISAMCLKGGRGRSNMASRMKRAAPVPGLGFLGRRDIGTASKKKGKRTSKSSSSTSFACMAASPSAAGKPEAAQHDNSLIGIIRKQAFNGTWSLAYATDLLSKSSADMTALVAKLSLSDVVKGNDALIGTAIVVAYLKRRYASNAVEWAMVVAKAEKWMASASGMPARTLIQAVAPLLP